MPLFLIQLRCAQNYACSSLSQFRADIDDASALHGLADRTDKIHFCHCLSEQAKYVHTAKHECSCSGHTSVGDSLLISPARDHGPANAFIVQERLWISRHVFCSPEHRPVAIGDLPCAPCPLEIPFIYRIIPSATPTNTFRKASSDHGLE